MGTPKIVIEFLKKSATLIKRSGRGMVVLILQDETQSQVLNPYMGIDEVNQNDWTERNYDYIKMTFKAEPNQVLCVRAVVKDGVIDIKATLELVRYINFDYMASPYFNKSDGEIIKAFIKKSEVKERKPRLYWQTMRQTVKQSLILQLLL